MSGTLQLRGGAMPFVSALSATVWYLRAHIRVSCSEDGAAMRLTVGRSPSRIRSMLGGG